MSGREWKPGDVARGRRVGSDADENFLRLENTGSLRWLDSHQCAWADDELGGLHPVAVIDPEDREQVERLARALYPFGMRIGGSCGPERLIEPTGAALREFANPKPPKPDEPQGLGAVVVAEYRDEHTKVTHSRRAWSRTGDGSWICISDGASRTSTAWPFLSNVRVLSEGVTP